MHFEPCILSQTESEETILDYAFISEQNFLLVIGLTSNANLIIHYRAGSTEQIKTISARNLYPEWLEPVLVVITPDASVVCLVQNDGDALVLPIRLLIDVNWCSSNNICTEPVLIKTKIQETNPLFKLPTCAVSFISRFSNKAYVIYGNKGGRIIAINLATKMVTACLKGECTISDLQLYIDKDFSYLLITEGGGYQTVVTLESPKCSLRETLNYFNTEYFEEKHLRFFCLHNDRRIVALDFSKNVAYFYNNMEKHAQVADTHVKLPETTWMIHCSSKAVVCVTESNHIFYNLLFIPHDDQSPYILNVSQIEDKILGIVPIINHGDELDNCFIMTEKQFILFKPKLTVNEVILNFLSGEYFSASLLAEIGSKLNKNTKQIAEQLLDLALFTWSKSEHKDANDKDLNGALALAMEVNVDMDGIIKVLSVYNGTELIVPFLMAMCEKDGKFWNSLLEVHEIKLKKLKKQNVQEKETLERDLRDCFVYCSASKATFKLLLKNSMWSAALILLSKDPVQYSDIAAEHLMELQTLSEVPPDQLAKCLNLISWNNLEAYILPMLNKAISCLAQIEDGIQLALLANFGQDLFLKFPIQSVVLYSIATIRYLHYGRPNSLLADIPPVVLSVGSNCCVALDCDKNALFWGEFSAGGVRIQSDSRLKTRKSNKSAPPPLVKPRKPTLFPQKICFSAGEEPVIVASSCGTESVLLLTADGVVYSYGKNSFGQCGVGHKNEVTSPTPVLNNYGRAKKVFSGHYHSGLINENDEVFLWGWSIHGQLAHDLSVVRDYHDSRLSPSKVTILPPEHRIIELALGYGHTLFLTDNGQVYGCGAASFGQLAMEPETMKKVIKQLTNIKCMSLYKIPLPEPVRLLSSNYFHTIAVGHSETIYEWGSCPLSVKIKMCLTKKFNNTIRDQLKKQMENGKDEKEKKVDSPENTAKPSTPSKSSPSTVSPPGLMQKIKSDVTKDYMKVNVVEKWPDNRSPIKQISAGYSHNTLVTEDGQLFSWGKSLDMQLGHGNKVEKEKPTKVIEPIMTNWKLALAGRCMTTAVSSSGRIYVWGRNDKYQLGLGYTKKVERKFIFRNNEKRTVELPDDNCITKPTPIPGLMVSVCQAMSYHDREHLLSSHLIAADQQTLGSVSRNLAKHPVMVNAAAQVHIAAGDVLNAVDVLCGIREKYKPVRDNVSTSATSSNRTLPVSSPQRHYNSLPRAARHPAVELNRNTPPPTFPWNFDDKNGNSTEGMLLSPVSNVSAKSEDDVFDDLLEKLWSLIRIHPFNDIQTLAILKMLQYKFPIYNRLAMDTRLCRLVDSFIELPLSASPNTSVHSVESAGHRKLTDMAAKERFAALKTAKMAPTNKTRALKQRSEQSSPLDQLRFYTDCGHYEKCIVESGPAKAEFAALRNKLRKCSRCAGKGRIV